MSRIRAEVCSRLLLGSGRSPLALERWVHSVDVSPTNGSGLACEGSINKQLTENNTMSRIVRNFIFFRTIK
jgi:hypothetical protein